MLSIALEGYWCFFSRAVRWCGALLVFFCGGGSGGGGGGGELDLGSRIADASWILIVARMGLLGFVVPAKFTA